MRRSSRFLTCDDLMRHMGCAHAMRLSLEGAVAPILDKAETLAAMAAKAETISPAVLCNENWQVAIDRIERHGALYEPLLICNDEPTPHEILRLCLAAQILSELQNEPPLHIHLLKGDGERESLPFAHYRHYARSACDALLAFVQEQPATAPIPVKACSCCSWAESCAADWRAEDSLYQIPSLSRGQVKKLQAAGITTKTELSQSKAPLRGIGTKSLSKLSAKARLLGEELAYELLPPEAGKGFTLLPRPDTGDFFYMPDAGQLSRPDLDLAPIEGLKSLLQLLREGLSENPKAHIYHFGAKPLEELKRQITQSGIGEALLDRLLREGRFVDLASLVKGAILTSLAGNELTDLRAFFAPHEDDPSKLLKALRDWLISLRPEGDWPECTVAAEDKEQQEEDEIAALRETLAAANIAPERKELLFNLALFHKRELKPAYWAVFDSLGKDEEELFDDLEALAGLEAISQIEPIKRSYQRIYRYPLQETKLRSGKKVVVRGADSLPATLTIEAMDRNSREITLKAGPKKADLLANELNLHPDWPLDTKVIAEALRDVVEDQCGPKQYRAIEALLSREAPRLRQGAIGPLRDAVADVTQAALALDHSVLPIQGPPGTGKTYVTARAITALLQKGYRIGVASNSHDAIRNLMLGTLKALEESGEAQSFSLIHKVSSSDDGYAPDCPIERTTDNGFAASNGDLIGGTAFFFARPENVQAFDYLIVDEAGQVGLAGLTAMARAAKSLILVGDPQQLPQVIQGAHPYPLHLSCLEYLLGGAATLPEGRGYFLPISRRMHPEVCQYISEQIYEGRLTSHESAAERHIRVDGLPEAGAYWQDVHHEGNQQSAPEEVAAIKAMIQRLLRGKWCEGGNERALSGEDIIVVAPFNAQVNALREALPADIRVGTVDKFQGQEAPIALVSMTASDASESARGMEFLLSRNRINVAVSRAKALVIVFGSPLLRLSPCETLEEMHLVNTMCALPKIAE